MTRPSPFLLIGAILVSCSIAVAQPDGIQTVVQKGHTDNITALDFSRDGRYFVTGSADHSVKLWDLKTGREVRTFKGHRGEITDVSIDSRNEFIVSSAGDKGEAELRVWDLSSGEAQNEIEGGKKLNILKALIGKVEFEWAFQLRSFDLRDDGTLVWAEDNQGVKMGNISKSKYDKVLPTNWQPTIVRYSPDGTRIVAGAQSFYRAVGKESNEVLVWNADNTDEQLSLKTRLSDITTLSFDQSGKLLAVLSHSNDSTVTKVKGPLALITFLNVAEVFDISSGRKLFETSWVGTKSNVLSLSPDGRTIVTSHKNVEENNTSLVIYDVQKKTEHKRFDSTEKEIFSLGFSPDGRILIANGKQINFWRTGSWTHLREVYRSGKIDDFELISDKLFTYRFGESFNSINTLSLETGNYESLQILPAQKIKHYNNQVFVSRGGKIEKYDASGNILVKTLVEKVEDWETVSDFFIDEATNYLICINSEKKDIYVQSLKKNEPGFLLKGHRRGVNFIALYGTQLASAGSDNKIILWDLVSKSKGGELLGHNSDVITLDFNHDGTMLASGSSDNYVKLWDVKKMVQVVTLSGHKNDVLSVDFNSTGDFLASSSGSLLYEGESEIMLWDVKKKKSVWKVPGNEGYTSKVVFSKNRIYSVGNEAVIKILDVEKGDQKFFFAPLTSIDFVMSTFDNYYLSTKGSLQFVHFVKSNKVYSFENFDLKFNRPDLVLSALGSTNTELISAYRKLYLRRLKRNGFTEAQIDKITVVPSSSILNSDSISYLATASNVKLSLEFSDDRFPLKYYNVWVNSVPYFGAKGVRILVKDSRKFNISHILPLSEGYNKIEVGCINEKGARSPRELIEVFYTGKQKSDLYLITVCASEYANPSLNLTYSVKDGQDMTNLFKNDKEFDNIKLTTLYNNQVTKTNFNSLRQKLMDSKPDDEVILFMAGHGTLDKNFDFHFVTYDMNMEQLEQTAITFENIENLIDSIPARKKMILIDACHSGGIDKEEIEEKVSELTSGKQVKIQKMDAIRKNVFNAFYGVDNTSVKLMEEMFHNLGEGSGAYVISAASVNGYALESEQWNNGVFTYSILDGLSNGKADTDKDGAVKVSELKTFLLENVVLLTGNQQRPTCRKENPDLDFIVWKK